MVGRLQNAQIDEASGLARSQRYPDVFWVANDDGPSVLYAIDSTGKDLGRVTIKDASNRDWEDLASFTLDGVPYLLAADIGDYRTIAIVAMLDDKDVEGFARSLDGQVDLWVATTASGARSLPAGELARRIANVTGRPCLIADSCEDALQVAEKEAATGDRIVVTGSFYLVGPVLQRLGLYSRRSP